MILLPYLLCILLVFLASLFVARKVSKHGVGMTVVSNLAALTRQNLPLTVGLRFAAEYESGKRAVILHRIARLLEQGTSLSRSMRQGWPGCPGIILSTIAVAERNHHLPSTLARLETYLADLGKRHRQFRFSNALYPLVLLSFGGIVLAAVMIIVVPKFEEIFADFDAPLPRTTSALIHTANWFIGKGADSSGAQDHVPGVLLIALLCFPVVAFFIAQRIRRPDKPLFFSRVSDTLKWYLPGWHRIEHASGIAHAAGCIRSGLLAGLTLHRAVRNAADLDLNIVLRRRLWRWAENLERGTPTDQAARDANLGPFFEWAFASPSAGSALPDSLGFIQDYYHAAAIHWADIVRQILWPFVVIGLGVLVGILVLALFMPLIALIDSVSENFYGDFS